MAKQSGLNSINSLEETLNEYFGKKAPQLPPNVKETIVKYSPWITLVFLILSLPAVLFLLGLGTLLTPFSYMAGVHFGITYTISMIILVGTLILEGFAIPLLIKRNKKGWNLVFYAALLSIVSNLVSFNLGSLIIGGLLSLYFLFQIRSYYK